jgi:hypothetical protein
LRISYRIAVSLPSIVLKDFMKLNLSFLPCGNQNLTSSQYYTVCPKNHGGVSNVQIARMKQDGDMTHDTGKDGGEDVRVPLETVNQASYCNCHS